MQPKMGKILFLERKDSTLSTNDSTVNITLNNGGKYYGEKDNKQTE